jgi:hypothetical protein
LQKPIDIIIQQTYRKYFLIQYINYSDKKITKYKIKKLYSNSIKIIRNSGLGLNGWGNNRLPAQNQSDHQSGRALPVRMTAIPQGNCSAFR